MPAPLDLAGCRFGRLLVIERAGRVKFGTEQPAWRCLCDCGRVEVLPQNRLPHRASIAPRHAVTECVHCRHARICTVCRRPFQSTQIRTTCSDQCRLIVRRGTSLDYYYRVAALDPAINVKNHAAARARAAADPAVAARRAAAERATNARKADRLRADPALLARLREQQRQRYSANAARVQTARRERYEAMTPAERARYLDRIRAYGRAYKARWRDEIAADPQAHQQYLDRMREYRRLRALKDLTAIGGRLIERLDDQ